MQKHHQHPNIQALSSPCHPPTGSAGFGVCLLQWLQVQDSGDTHKSGGEQGECSSQWGPRGGTSLRRGPRSSAVSLRAGYLRDAEGAVQPLQRTLLMSQSHSAAPQPARRAAGILRLPARGTPKARCGGWPCASPGGAPREAGCPQTSENARLLPPPPVVPSAPPGSSSAGLGAAGESQRPPAWLPAWLPGSARGWPLARRAREMPGGRNSDQEGKRGWGRGGDTYPALSL